MLGEYGKSKHLLSYSEWKNFESILNSNNF
jgi:hypothetical protein